MKIAFGVPGNMLSLVTALTRQFEVETEGVLPGVESLMETVELLQPEAVVLSDTLPGAGGLTALAAKLQGEGRKLVVLTTGGVEAETWQSLRGEGVILLQAGSDGVVEEMARALTLAPRPIPGHVTVVPANVKGGVGKSFLAVNLAVAFKESDPSMRVMLLDGHPQGDVGPLLGVNDGLTLADLVERHPENVAQGELEDFVQTHASGVDLLVAPRRLGRYAPPGRGLFRELVKELRRVYHVLVIDTDTDLHLAPTVLALSLAEVILLVTTPEAMGVRGLLMLKDVLQELGLLGRARIVLNKVRGPVDESELQRIIGAPTIARIPFDVTVLEAENKLRPVLGEGGKAASAVRNLAARLLKEAKDGAAG